MRKSFGFWFTALTVAFLLALTSAPALPQEEKKDQEVTDKELMELLGMTVEAASKREESVMTAPAVVSVLTAQDIKELGVLKVSDAVNYIAGVHAYPHYGGEAVFFGMRGSYKEFSTDILFLVNGHPFFRSVDGWYDVNAIPIDAIERIEVIRGPVSVIYGTNAMTGVINIVTWKEPNFLNGQLHYQYGSFGTHEVRASLGKSYEKFRYFISGTYKTQDGYDYAVKPDQDMLGVGYSHTFYEKLKSVFLNMAYEDLEVDISYSAMNNGSLIGLLPNSLYYLGTWDLPSIYADIRYKRELAENTTLNFKFRADSQEAGWAPDVVNVTIGESRAKGKKYGLELFLDTNLTGKTKALVGASYDRYHTDRYQTIMLAKIPIYSLTFICPDTTTSDTALFVNLNHQATDQMNLLAGVRYTNNSVTGDHTDYHLGSVFDLNKSLALKLLYGTSYRSPNHFEMYIYGFPAFMGNGNLKFETMQGVDVALVYNYRNVLLASGGYFWNKFDNYITLIPVGFIPTYTNIKGRELQGMEFELKYRPSKQLSLFFNTTNVLSGKDLALDTDLTIIKNMVNFGISVKPIDQLMITNSNYYHSAWGPADGYLLSNLALYYTLSRRQPGVELVLLANNLFDKEYNYYSIYAPLAQNPTFAGVPPRSVTAGITVSF